MNENYVLSINVNYINREVNDSKVMLSTKECVSQILKGCN